VKGLPRIRILLGSNNHAVQSAASGSSGSGSPSQSSSPGQQRTAAQDACH
jgi:hypothetical protein